MLIWKSEWHKINEVSVSWQKRMKFDEQRLL